MQFSDLATAIQRRRKELGLTQRQMADLAECSEVFVVNLEAGKETVRLDKLIDVLRVLGLQLRLETGKEGLTFSDADL